VLTRDASAHECHIACSRLPQATSVATPAALKGTRAEFHIISSTRHFDNGRVLTSSPADLYLGKRGVVGARAVRAFDGRAVGAWPVRAGLKVEPLGRGRVSGCHAHWSTHVVGRE
jgi:hypothetical protein